MSVYVDKLQNYAKHPTATYLRCHMWADELYELHRMADAIGLKRSWLQIRDSKTFKYHYDLSPIKRDMAVNCGAVEMPASKWLMAQKEKDVQS